MQEEIQKLILKYNAGRKMDRNNDQDIHINTSYLYILHIKKDSTTDRAIGRHQTTVKFTNESLYYSIYSECHRKALYMKKGNRNVKV